MKHHLTTLRNLAVFLSCVIPHGLPPWKWPRYWRAAQEGHRQWVHKTVWELKKAGCVREDREDRLWSNRK